MRRGAEVDTNLHPLQAKHVRHERLAGAVTALQAGCLLRAWRSWAEHVATSLHKRQLLRVAAGRIANHRAHATFSAWQVSAPAC
jgi:hypothetical protein